MYIKWSLRNTCSPVEFWKATQGTLENYSEGNVSVEGG